MKTKYYTPEIEELHVGFEHEVSWFRQDGEKLWDKRTYSKHNSIPECLFPNDDIRVKYLDQEDIESLGWKLTGRGGNDHIETWDFEIPIEDGWKYVLSLIYPTKNDYVHENVAIYLVKDNEPPVLEEHTKFDGTIKNKSELKRLMRQLNIT